ncbi:hypothetical protein BON23_5331 [Saccharomyces cerevisiae]|nr:hypothetical protein BON23_5331 [Saccharomyces cerevisiae]
MKVSDRLRSFYEDEKSGLIKVVKFRTGAMDRKRSFEKIVVSVMVGKNVQKFLTFERTRFPADNPFKVSYSQENQLDGLHVVSSAYFEIQKGYIPFSFTSTEEQRIDFPCPGTFHK